MRGLSFDDLIEVIIFAIIFLGGIGQAIVRWFNRRREEQKEKARRLQRQTIEPLQRDPAASPYPTANPLPTARPMPQRPISAPPAMPPPVKQPPTRPALSQLSGELRRMIEAAREGEQPRPAPTRPRVKVRTVPPSEKRAAKADRSRRVLPDAVESTESDAEQTYARPVAEHHLRLSAHVEHPATESVSATAASQKFLRKKLSLEDARRAILLAEIFGPPLALRGEDNSFRPGF